jgi:hypothetical protein
LTFSFIQGEGSVTLHDPGANDVPAPSERLALTESEATDAGFSTMDHEPTLNSGESESVSGVPETLSENDPSDGEEIFYFVIDFLKPKIILLIINTTHFQCRALLHSTLID